MQTSLNENQRLKIDDLQKINYALQIVYPDSKKKIIEKILLVATSED